MLRGYYTAASGIVTSEKKLNTYANNLSNASTTGYKKDDLVSGTFGEHLAVRMNTYQGVPHHAIGRGVYMQVVDEKYTNYTQGGFEFTERPMDFAIAGEGFFLVTDSEGGEFLTRDGQFSIDEEGYLVLPGFGRVQGEGGDLQIGTSFFGVDKMGNIYLTPPDAEEGEEPEQIGRLLVVAPDDYTALEKAQTGLYTAEDFAAVEPDQIMQGRLERSNVNMAEEMTRMMSSQRQFQTCSQIVKMYDDLAEKINTQLARV